MGFALRLALAIAGIFAFMVTLAGFSFMAFGISWELMEEGGYLWLAVVGFFLILTGIVLSMYTSHLSERDKRMEDIEFEKKMTREDPLDVLKLRYARGELSTKEYKERKKVLERAGE